jgi:hypothetical protein
MDSKHPQRRQRYMPRKRRKPRMLRDKTFRSEDAAKIYAEENGIKNYELKRLALGLSKKVKIIEK